MCIYSRTRKSETYFSLYLDTKIVINTSENQTLSQDELLVLARKNASTCGICLDDLSIKCAYSSNNECKHLFHEDCIVTWLSSRRDLRCPICRQIFICTPIRSLDTSQASQREFLSNFQTEEGGNDPIDVGRQNSDSTTTA
jgi:hypothetical protein